MTIRARAAAVMMVLVAAVAVGLAGPSAEPSHPGVAAIDCPPSATGGGGPGC